MGDEIAGGRSTSSWGRPSWRASLPPFAAGFLAALGLAAFLAAGFLAFLAAGFLAATIFLRASLTRTPALAASTLLLATMYLRMAWREEPFLSLAGLAAADMVLTCWQVERFSH